MYVVTIMFPSIFFGFHISKNLFPPNRKVVAKKDKKEFMFIVLEYIQRFDRIFYESYFYRNHKIRLAIVALHLWKNIHP